MVGTAAIAGAASLSLLACGGGDDATTTGQGSDSPAASAAAPSERTATSDDNGVAVVPGPNPSKIGPPASIPADRHVPDVPGTKCGPTRGPDGALELVVFQGKVNCETAKKVADEYGPKIASGQKQTVQGWTCGPSDGENILAACAKGNNIFVFQIPN
ncbi:hypothetical protein GOARA_008_00180 [Gordonia araii NBRC 100433]|uniref:Lipoprotein n=2 Tax=Gordonia araii TaxID=263909 RepID=G7GXJ3_9ACTN|nr:hypothetical protein GOARA_008_00180 [Gordonia araii NBRC 100433]